MTILLSKSNYRQSLTCPRTLWLSAHDSSQLQGPSFSDQWRFEQGNIFESLVREAYPGGLMITGYGHDAARETQRAIEAGTRTLFQATAISADGCLAMADILQLEGDGETCARTPIPSCLRM
jgi:hypothetical protein